MFVHVSSLNECHKIDTSSRARKTVHMRSRQNVPAGPRWHPNLGIAWYPLNSVFFLVLKITLAPSGKPVAAIGDGISIVDPSSLRIFPNVSAEMEA